MRVKELYHLSLKYEESVLAHYIYHLIQEKIINLEDEVEKLDLNEADHEKVAMMIENNVLGFQTIRIYALTYARKKYIFIFARNEKEATQHFIKTFQQKPLSCVELLLDYEIMRGNEVTTFRELRKEYDRFPVLIGGFFL